MLRKKFIKNEKTENQKQHLHMRKYNNFSHHCQYKSNNSSVIIVPNAIYASQLLTDHSLAAKHLMVLCHSLRSCWRNQPSWSGEQRPKLDSMLARPLRAKMIELNYRRLGKALSLTSDQLKNIIVDLEQAKLLKRVLFGNNWYILLLDEAFKMYLNNNQSKKHRINKGNVISNAWLDVLKTDNDQPDFTGALVVGEVAFFSRVLKINQPIDDYANFLKDKTREEEAREAKPLLVSKSKGLVAYFEYDHFKKKFPFIDNQTINRALARLEKNNSISVERIKFTKNRRVVKRLYITLNYELIKKQTDKTIVNFIFKTEDYLNDDQLTSFAQNTPPFIYNHYYNKTISYPRPGFSSNFASFSSLSSTSCLATYSQTEPKEQLNPKKWYQVTYSNGKDNAEDDNDNDIDSNSGSGVGSSRDEGKDKQKLSKYQQISSLSSIESFWSKKRAFKVSRYLSEMHSSLKRLYSSYFTSFNYPLPFCYQLLDSLAKKYPGASFMGENQFISYFRKILAQEKKASWLVRSRQYFGKALGLAELAYDKLPKTVKEKLNQLATRAGKRIEELPELLSRLAIRNAKHVFSCVSSFLSYMKQVLQKLKSKEEIQEAYSALPRVNISEVASYLSAVEASYSRVGPQEHLRRKLASTLPMTIAYHLLSCCNFYSAKVDNEKNFIIPSKNKNWAEMIRGGIKNIIKDQVAAVYGTIKAIKFVQVLRTEEAVKDKKLVSDTCEKNKASLEVGVRETKAFSRAKQQQLRYALAEDDADVTNEQSTESKLTSYHLFQKKRLEQEQKEREELKARMLEEEQELKRSNLDLVVYEKYKQVVEETEREREKYIQRGGVKELARELYRVLSFREWIQLQELMGMV